MVSTRSCVHVQVLMRKTDKNCLLVKLIKLFLTFRIIKQSIKVKKEETDFNLGYYIL